MWARPPLRRLQFGAARRDPRGRRRRGDEVVEVFDTVTGRVLLRPQELMVGVVTAFVGAPILLLAVRRLGRRAQA